MEHDTIELILDSIEDTIRGNIENYKSPFEMDVQRIINYCRKRKKEIIREFLEEWKTSLEEELKEEILDENTGKLVPLYEYDEIWKDLGYKLEELEGED